MFNKWYIVICLVTLITCLEHTIYAVNPNLENNSVESGKQQRVVNIIDPTTRKVIKTFSPNDYKMETEFERYRQEIEKWAESLANGTVTQEGYNQVMILDRIDKDGKIIKGKPMITLNEKELVYRILEFSFSGGDVLLPLTVTHSGYQTQDIPHLNEVVIATYTTFFNMGKVGRSKNIELSAASIHNVIVGSGDYFSFNTIVGPREIATGYQMAPEIIKGKTVMGIGGGICQTSSTLFNAVDQLDVETIERHHHSKDVGYVPKGRDATVSFGGLDFRFQNTTGVPFLIKSYYGKGTLTVEIRTSKEYEELLKNELSYHHINY